MLCDLDFQSNYTEKNHLLHYPDFVNHHNQNHYQIYFLGKNHLFYWKFSAFAAARFRCWKFRRHAPIKSKMVNKQGGFSPCVPFKS